jgi:hypothetical protein
MQNSLTARLGFTKAAGFESIIRLKTNSMTPSISQNDIPTFYLQARVLIPA